SLASGFWRQRPAASSQQPPLERLSNRKVNAPAAEVRLAVDEQFRRRIQLIPEVEADRPDRRLVSQAGADRGADVAEPEAQGFLPHVAGVHEQHRTEIAVDAGANFLAPREHRVAADRKAVDERAHLVPAPASNARRAAEEVALRERNVLPRVAER